MRRCSNGHVLIDSAKRITPLEEQMLYVVVDFARYENHPLTGLRVSHCEV